MIRVILELVVAVVGMKFNLPFVWINGPIDVKLIIPNQLIAGRRSDIFLSSTRVGLEGEAAIITVFETALAP